MAALAGAGVDVAKLRAPVSSAGWSALLLASLHGKAALAQRLLGEWGADANEADRCGATPATVAAARGHFAVLRVLQTAGADLGHKGSAGLSPADFEALGGAPWLLKELILEAGLAVPPTAGGAIGIASGAGGDTVSTQVSIGAGAGESSFRGGVGGGVGGAGTSQPSQHSAPPHCAPESCEVPDGAATAWAHAQVTVAELPLGAPPRLHRLVATSSAHLGAGACVLRYFSFLFMSEC